jgi:clan AA aspartic protease (TIGR02281 family)
MNFRIMLALAFALFPEVAQAEISMIVDGKAYRIPDGAQASIVQGPDGPLVMQVTMEQQATNTGYAYVPKATYAQPVEPVLAYEQIQEPEGITGAAAQNPLKIKRDRFSGHFIAPVIMNGVKIKAIIDTGATSTVLSPEDAMATGAYNDATHQRPGVGIGGYTTLTVTRVRSLQIGADTLSSFAADIGQQGIRYTLLGESEIAKLGKIVIEGDIMTIYPRAQLKLASK